MEFTVGFIGGGSIAGHHADQITNLGHEVTAITDIDETARESFAETYGATGQYVDYEEMLDAEDLDVVVVAVPNALHGACSIAALERDINVFVEKPLAHSLESAEQVAAAEAESDAEAMVGFMKAFDPHVEAIAADVANHAYGDVYEVSVEYVRRRGIPQIGSWFTRKDISGGGALIDIGPHVLHLAFYVLDFPTIEAVSATAGTHFGGREDYTYLSMWGGDPIPDGEFDVDDHARAMIRTDAGTVNLNVAWASNREPRQQIRVLGDDAGATFRVDSENLTIYSTRQGGLSDEALTLPQGDPYLAEWMYFFEVLRGERRHTRNTVDEGVHVQRTIEAIYESAEQGEEIGLE